MPIDIQIKNYTSSLVIYCSLSSQQMFYGLFVQVVSASGAVKHEEVVEQVKKLFTKLSTNADTTCQLVAKEPSRFTGSEVSALA